MISVKEAKNIINSQITNWGSHRVPLEGSLGEVLAEDIFADRNFPPFDRVTMDGIALSFDAFDTGKRKFKIQETQLAGEPATRLKDEGCAIEIMTGAILSTGCDLVIRYEDLEFFEEANERWVGINLPAAERWKNVHKEGSDQGKGELLITKGAIITAGEIAIMATVGCHEVLVQRKPKVAIVSTGDELVDVSEQPLPHQIRKSNSVVIQSTLNQMKIPNKVYHLLDDKPSLLEKIKDILASYDLVLLSGGVSKGKADYLPEVLDELGVEQLFHKVAQRPGKPFWFGAKPNGPQVFAFPGNPISTYMCFRVYFIPWALKNLGRKPIQLHADLMEPFHFNKPLGYFLQVRSEPDEQGTVKVFPQTGNGSGDLANLSKSDAFVYLPKDQNEFAAGQSLHYFPFDVSNLA